MIRFVLMARRKAGMTLAEFSDYWRNEHGPLVASYQATLGMVRYCQTHRDVNAEGEDSGTPVRDARGGMTAPYDGVAEIWFKSEAAVSEAFSTDAGRRASEALIRDEESCIDLPSSPFWFAHEYPQVSSVHERPVAKLKTGIVKALFPLRQLPTMSVEEAQRYWLTVHGPLIRSHAVARGAICYQQVHRFDSVLLEPMREARGTIAEPYIGHAEGWFDRLLPRSGPEADAAGRASLEDERNFIDWSRSTVWVGKELLFVDRNWD